MPSCLHVRPRAFDRARDARRKGDFCRERAGEKFALASHRIQKMFRDTQCSRRGPQMLRRRLLHRIESSPESPGLVQSLTRHASRDAQAREHSRRDLPRRHRPRLRAIREREFAPLLCVRASLKSVSVSHLEPVIWPSGASASRSRGRPALSSGLAAGRPPGPCRYRTLGGRWSAVVDEPACSFADGRTRGERGLPWALRRAGQLAAHIRSCPPSRVDSASTSRRSMGLLRLALRSRLSRAQSELRPSSAQPACAADSMCAAGLAKSIVTSLLCFARQDWPMRPSAEVSPGRTCLPCRRFATGVKIAEARGGIRLDRASR